MKSRVHGFLIAGFLIFGLSGIMSLPSVGFGAIAGVTVGCADIVKCPGGIGFVDDRTGAGPDVLSEATNISIGDTVHWHWEAGGFHSVTSQAALGSNAAAPCATGDSFNSGILPAPGSTFDHTFITGGSCTYFCQVHGVLMQWQVNVGKISLPSSTLTATTSTTSMPTTTTVSITTTTNTTTTTLFPTTTTTTTTTTVGRTTTTVRRCGNGDHGNGRGSERCRRGLGGNRDE